MKAPQVDYRKSTKKPHLQPKMSISAEIRDITEINTDDEVRTPRDRTPRNRTPEKQQEPANLQQIHETQLALLKVLRA